MRWLGVEWPSSSLFPSLSHPLILFSSHPLILFSSHPLILSSSFLLILSSSFPLILSSCFIISSGDFLIESFILISRSYLIFQLNKKVIKDINNIILLYYLYRFTNQNYETHSAWFINIVSMVTECHLSLPHRIPSSPLRRRCDLITGLLGSSHQVRHLYLSVCVWELCVNTRTESLAVCCVGAWMKRGVASSRSGCKGAWLPHAMAARGRGFHRKWLERGVASSRTSLQSNEH